MLAVMLLAPLVLFPHQDDPAVAPIQVRTVLTPCTDQGTFLLRLECTPSEKLSVDHGLRVALNVGVEDVSQADHQLRPSPRSWAVGETVDLEIPLTLPEGLELEPGDLVSVRLGFTAGGAVLSPDVERHLIDPDGLADLEAFDVPRFAGVAGARRLAEVLAEGAALRKEDPPAAWRLLSRALRDAADEETKERVRDALIEVGRFQPAAPSEVEERIIGQRIREEKVRYFRLEAGRMAARGKLHGALRLLEEVGGALAMDADEAVIGALDQAERALSRIEDLQERLLTELSSKEEAEVEAAVEEHGRTEDLLDHANRLAGRREQPVALALYRKLRRVDGIELYDAAQARLEEVG